MSKLSAGIVKFNKQKSIPAIVIDVVGRTCTVVLSGRGKVLHGVSFIGPSPTVGDSVIVNYISGKPIVEAGAQTVVTTPASSAAPRPSSRAEARSSYHNDMKGLQGGAEAGLSSNAEYYHLTQTEYEALGGPGGGVEEAPEDGTPYARQDAGWVPASSGGFVSIKIDQSGGTEDTYGELVGDRNGINTSFTVSAGSYLTGRLAVYENGQLLTQGSDADWVEDTPASGTFTFIEAPEATDELLVVYESDDEAVISDQTDQHGGSDDTYGVLEQAYLTPSVFAVSKGFYISGTLLVFLNGQLLVQGTSEDWQELAPQSGTFQLTNEPDEDDIVTASYKFIGSSEYILPIATDILLGGIKVGDRLSIDVDGILSADTQDKDASDITFTPAETGDWDADTDPGDVDEALDQLASHVADMESIKADTYFVTGFTNRTSSTLSLATRTLTVGVVSGSFTIWSAGNKFVKTGGATCETTIPADIGLHYIYFDTNGVLQNTDDAWDITSANIPVCTIYWNGSAGAVCDERHGAGRNQEWHQWAHDTIGCRYETGLNQTYPTAANDGYSQIEAGIIHDEDIDFEVGEDDPVKLVRLWYETDSAVWTWANGTDNGGYDRPYIWNAATSKVRFPKSDSSYALTDGSNSNYIVVWVFATTDIDRPIYLITAAKTSAYANLAAARQATQPSTAGLLTPEMKLIYRWIFRGDGEYQEAVDYRASSSLPAGGTPTTAAIGVKFTPAGDLSSTNVQAALEELDTEKSSTGHTHDAGAVTYTPAVDTDWDSDADPGDTSDALDQLAERVDDLEGAGPPASDASDITYTPTTAADWDSDTDPGNVDGALDQLAERVTDIEGAPPGGGGDAADITYTPTTAADWDGSADPGNADDAFDQLAERVKDLEGATATVSIIEIQVFM